MKRKIYCINRESEEATRQLGIVLLPAKASTGTLSVNEPKYVPETERQRARARTATFAENTRAI